MSTPRFLLLCFLSLTTCRVDPKREPALRAPKVSSAGRAAGVEIFPRVFAEPQPLADALLVNSGVTECLAGTPRLNDPLFSIELRGRVSDAGRVEEVHVDAPEARVAACLEQAFSRLVLSPHAAGAFHLNLSRSPVGAGPGVLVVPGGLKNYE